MGRSAITAQLADLLFKEHYAKVAICGWNQWSSQVTVSRPIEWIVSLNPSQEVSLPLFMQGRDMILGWIWGFIEGSLTEGRSSNATISCKEDL